MRGRPTDSPSAPTMASSGTCAIASGPCLAARFNAAKPRSTRACSSERNDPQGCFSRPTTRKSASCCIVCGQHATMTRLHGRALLTRRAGAHVQPGANRLSQLLQGPRQRRQTCCACHLTGHLTGSRCKSGRQCPSTGATSRRLLETAHLPDTEQHSVRAGARQAVIKRQLPACATAQEGGGVGHKRCSKLLCGMAGSESALLGCNEDADVRS